MAATTSQLRKGLGLVLVEYEYQYEGRDGSMVSIKPNERYVLLCKTNAHWWQVRSDAGSKSFYIPAKYVKELPADFPSPLDFSDQSAPEPVPLPLPTQTPVPVPVPKLEESRSRAGDQVTIRVRPDPTTRYRRNENRMSTFGVLLDVHEPPRHPTNESVTDGVQEDHRDTGKSRVPSFSPADPLPGPRTHNQPIPVEMPVVPPLTNKVLQSSSTSDPHDNQQPMTEPEEAEEADISTEGSAEEEEKEEESHHIYESIQDLNLDLKTLCEEQATPTTQEQSSLGPTSPIYANVSSLKKTLVNTDPAHSAVDHTPCSPDPASSPRSPKEGWQVHTDQQSGKRFYFHPLTRQSTWTSPPPPPAEAQEPSSPVLSPASSQGSSSVWEQIMDEASGRFYYYNPLTGNTSWNPPSQDNPPPLPELDYPLNDQENNDVFSTKVDSTAEENKETNKSTWRQSEMLPQRMMGNGVSEEAPVRSWRHSVAEDMLSNHRRNVSDFTEVANSRNSPESPQMLEKAGILNKTKVVENGKRIRKNWSQSWTVLHGGILTFHRDPKSAPAGNTSKSSQIVPEFTVELRGSSLGWAAKDKSSKKNVLELRTRQGCEFLMQYDTESIICDWLKVIQDTIRQLEQDHLSEDDEDSDKDDTERRRMSNRNSSSSSGHDSEQRRVRNKLRRFLQRRPTLQSVKERGYIRDNVFGCHLDTLCHRENSTIPKFVEKCIRTVERRGLDIDGIYRVSGNLAVIQKLRHKADHEEQLDLEDGQWEEIHVITGALKLFLRELPEPLFPFSSFTKFITAIQDPDYTQRVSYIKALVQTLPLPNHDTMELLFRHLRRVIEHRDGNRMSVQGVSIVFGPTLLRPQTESANMTMNMVFQSQIVELLLNEFLTIFSKS